MSTRTTTCRFHTAQPTTNGYTTNRTVRIISTATTSFYTSQYTTLNQLYCIARYVLQNSIKYFSTRFIKKNNYYYYPQIRSCLRFQTVRFGRKYNHNDTTCRQVCHPLDFIRVNNSKGHAEGRALYTYTSSDIISPSSSISGDVWTAHIALDGTQYVRSRKAITIRFRENCPIPNDTTGEYTENLYRSLLVETSRSRGEEGRHWCQVNVDFRISRADVNHYERYAGVSTVGSYLHQFQS